MCSIQPSSRSHQSFFSFVTVLFFHLFKNRFFFFSSLSTNSFCFFLVTQEVRDCCKWVIEAEKAVLDTLCFEIDDDNPFKYFGYFVSNVKKTFGDKSDIERCIVGVAIFAIKEAFSFSSFSSLSLFLRPAFLFLSF